MQNKKKHFFESAMPSRILYYENIAKGGSNAKQKKHFFESAMPSRILYISGTKCPVCPKHEQQTNVCNIKGTE